MADTIEIEHIDDGLNRRGRLGAAERLHPLVDGLRASLERPNNVTVGTFSAQVQAIYAELMLMQSQIDQLAAAVDVEGRAAVHPLLVHSPSDQDVGELSRFLETL